MKRRKMWVAAAAAGTLWLSSTQLQAFDILGTGTSSLLGNDLTDLGDDGDPEDDIGYDAIFDSSDEQGFAGGEFAFNVFDNRLGPSNDKWCCGKGGGVSEEDPAWVQATFPIGYTLTHFTVSSANDVPARDPNFWAIQGSNDGTNFTNIYTYDDATGPWDERLQVIQFAAGSDFPVQTQSYKTFRFATFNTPSNPNGAYFQVGEIEFFGNATGVVPPLFVGGENTIGTREYEGTVSNKVFGPETAGLDGWRAKLVDSETQISNHTIAEEVLDGDDGVVTIGNAAVVDFHGGAGTFDVNLPYPNDVDDESMEDFAVRTTAEVEIPVGTWVIGFGTDDGGQITIPGVTFLEASDPNDSGTDDQIRYEGNRGHDWTVGSFEVTGQPLKTTITASMHERGGGDTFEVAINSGDVIEDASAANGWELLGNGTKGWKVTHTGKPLISANLSAEAGGARPWQFDVNGTTDTADQFVVPNPDPNVYHTALNINGVTIEIKATGAVANGDAFRIINADTITGTPIIKSAIAGQTWVFDAATGRVCLGSCPAVGVGGDYNHDGKVDVADVDLQTEAMKTPGQNLSTFDENKDGTINYDDRVAWVKTHAFGGKGTWIGDADLNGEFNSDDFVQVFIAGKYETGDASGWGEGDWDGDGLFSSTDFVAAFIDGGYENGPLGAVSAVPEPASATLLMLGAVAACGSRRRRS